ncbi:hypothetical protein R84981_001175 [Carnimonas sp. R-84981]|uniref:S41 family peptidase n=1 Tax=Carnimonas bestiolae TaxID=3402172 RepID=UPI003EDBC838
MLSSSKLVLCFLLVGGLPDAAVGASGEITNNWRDIARSDLVYLHRDILRNHPGAVNVQDPPFLSRENQAFHLAHSRIPSVSNAAGYFWLMRGYVASFNNGHVAIAPAQELRLPESWPGFLTEYTDDNQQVVVYRAIDAPVPLGAKLLSCDGVSAEMIAHRNIGEFTGAWQLLAQRKLSGYRLFFDQGNPFVSRPAKCDFLAKGVRKRIQLHWRELTESEKSNVSDRVVQPDSRPIGLRRLSDGTWWLTLSSFIESDELNAAIKKLDAHRKEIIRSSRLVIDLRGNDGGMSDYATEVVRILWGQAAADALPAPDAVDFRATKDNLEWWKSAFSELVQQPTVPDTTKNWIADVISNLSTAIKAKHPFYTEQQVPSSAEQNAKHSGIAPTVYVLTDHRCYSSCLNAVDYFRSLGAVQIGQETNGDSLYMDSRKLTLPSGRLEASVPLEVLRNRPRGDLVTWKPEIPLPAHIKGDDAVESWVISLPERSHVVP